MVDKKVYKTDYESDFTKFSKDLEQDQNNPAVKAETVKYDRVNDLRDNKKAKNSRNKLWENF